MQSWAKLVCFWVMGQIAHQNLIAQNLPFANSNVVQMLSHLRAVNLPGQSGQSSTLDSLSQKTNNILVFITLSEVCMLSRYYAKEIEHMKNRWAKAEVRFYGVFPNPFSTAPQVEEFMKENQVRFAMLADSGGRFCKANQLKVTPEALVVKNGLVIYRGRIDDFYVAIGRHKTTTTRRFLEEALQAAQKGKTPVSPFVLPVGCVIDWRLWAN